MAGCTCPSSKRCQAIEIAYWLTGWNHSKGKVYCDNCINAHELEAASGSLADVASSPSARGRGAHVSHGQEQGSSEVWKIVDIKGKKGESAEALLGESNKQFCHLMQTKTEEISACGHVLKCVACPGGVAVVTQGLTAEEFQEKFVAMCHDVAGPARRVRVYLRNGGTKDAER